MAVALLVAGSTAFAQPAAPNILLIMLDDVGFADTSTFGGLAQTPVLDKLAAEGLRCTSCMSPRSMPR